jgi:hypothetical protein
MTTIAEANGNGKILEDLKKKLPNKNNKAGTIDIEKKIIADFSTNDDFSGREVIKDVKNGIEGMVGDFEQEGEKQTALTKETGNQGLIAEVESAVKDSLTKVNEAYQELCVQIEKLDDEIDNLEIINGGIQHDLRLKRDNLIAERKILTEKMTESEDNEKKLTFELQEIKEEVTSLNKLLQKEKSEEEKKVLLDEIDKLIDRKIQVITDLDYLIGMKNVSTEEDQTLQTDQESARSDEEPKRNAVYDKKVGLNGLNKQELSEIQQKINEAIKRISDISEELGKRKDYFKEVNKILYKTENENEYKKEMHDSKSLVEANERLSQLQNIIFKAEEELKIKKPKQIVQMPSSALEKIQQETNKLLAELGKLTRDLNEERKKYYENKIDEILKRSDQDTKIVRYKEIKAEDGKAEKAVQVLGDGQIKTGSVNFSEAKINQQAVIDLLNEAKLEVEAVNNTKQKAQEENDYVRRDIDNIASEINRLLVDLDDAKRIEFENKRKEIAKKNTSEDINILKQVEEEMNSLLLEVRETWKLAGDKKVVTEEEVKTEEVDNRSLKEVHNTTNNIISEIFDRSSELDEQRGREIRDELKITPSKTLEQARENEKAMRMKLEELIKEIAKAQEEKNQNQPTERLQKSIRSSEQKPDNERLADINLELREKTKELEDLERKIRDPQTGNDEYEGIEIEIRRVSAIIEELEAEKKEIEDRQKTERRKKEAIKAEWEKEIAKKIAGLELKISKIEERIKNTEIEIAAIPNEIQSERDIIDKINKLVQDGTYSKLYVQMKVEEIKNNPKDMKITSHNPDEEIAKHEKEIYALEKKISLKKELIGNSQKDIIKLQTEISDLRAQEYIELKTEEKEIKPTDHIRRLITEKEILEEKLEVFEMPDFIQGDLDEGQQKEIADIQKRLKEIELELEKVYTGNDKKLKKEIEIINPEDFIKYKNKFNTIKKEIVELAIDLELDKKYKSEMTKAYHNTLGKKTPDIKGMQNKTEELYEKIKNDAKEFLLENKEMISDLERENAVEKYFDVKQDRQKMIDELKKSKDIITEKCNKIEDLLIDLKK